jgi:hypothetical protein
VQTVGVVALVLLVGWPRYRPSTDVTVWRANGPATPEPDLVARDARVVAAQSPSRTAQVGRGTLAEGLATATPRFGAGTRPTTSLTPFDDTAAQLRSVGATTNAIVGRAVTELGQRVPYARLLLRNTITGQIEARATADQNGVFTFTDVVPSGYVIELVGADGSVLASSELVPLDNGDLKQATVRIAANSSVRAIFGNILTTPTSQDPLRQAIDSGTSNVTQPNATNSPQL